MSQESYLNRRARRKLGLPRNRAVPQVKRMYKKISRNDLCPCGSGKKFKNCECYERFGESKQYYTKEMLEEYAKGMKEIKDNETSE